ncbi:insulinase family protein [Telmatocola sphagniphila]|uniref:Insulinase family protein n=1 Tax=Telmatocola sphagniphila TaxID=1123043 RepID=A0A8E6EVS4_9BACT|nr:pitrilysin family protein [Telmatocola sphagniphila]QVL33145.1 insulinase family protein [Telmatocola sphagniphila]
MRLGFLLFAFLLALSPTGVRADEKSENAALLKTVSTVFDGIQHDTLPNGLRIYLKPIPNATTVTTMVGYKVGSADEELDQTGLSHYLEHLMFKGTDKIMPGDIDRLTQRNGGHNNAYTTEDMTIYHFDFAADRWMQALEIEADRMRHLKIDAQHEFEQEKGAVISELDGNEDDPWELENKALLPLLFGKQTPYGHPVIGEKTHVRAAAAEIIKQHYDRWYHPNNAVLVVAGGFDAKAALARIKELFGPIPAAKLPERKPVPKEVDRTRILKSKFQSKFDTPRLLVGFNTCTIGEPDDPALDVIQHALTDGRMSRLYKQLVEGEEVATTVVSNNNTGRYPGWFEIRIELADVEGIPKAEKTLQGVLKQISKDGLSQTEFARAKRSFIASYVFNLEDVHNLADLITRSVLDKDLDYLKSSLPRLMAISNSDIKRAARKYFVDRKPVIIESMPKATEKKKVGATASENVVSVLGRQQAAVKGSPIYDFSKARHETLPNGLRVVLLENHQLPIAFLNAYVQNVTMYEPPQLFGIAHLTGNMLDEGTKKHTGQQIAEIIESRAAKMSFSPNGGVMKLLSYDLKAGIDIFFECLTTPAFPANELESQREALRTQIQEEERKANERARIEFYARAYGEHPYGRAGMGNLEVIAKLKAEDLRKYHQQVFVPNNTIVAVVGDFNSDEVLKWLTAATAHWTRTKLPELPKIVVEKPKEGQEKILIDNEASQLHVYIGHVGVARTNPDFFKLMVFDNILGTGPGFTDRLSANLRDRQGLAYTVNATITATASDEPGLFIGYIGTFNDKFAQVKAGFLKEINQLREENPSAVEVENAKRFLIGSLPFTFSSNQKLAESLLMMERYGFKNDYFEKFVREVESVTPAQVTEMARKYIDPAKLIIVAAGAIDRNGQPLKKD